MGLPRKERCHIAVYVDPQVKKWMRVEAAKRDIYDMDFAEECLLFAMTWMKKTEIRERKEKKLSTDDQTTELKEYQKALEDKKNDNLQKRGV